MYYFILFFLVIIFAVSYRLINSLVGKTFIAIRDDENLTQSLGINTMSNKLVSFTISAIIAGIAGALFASYNTVISPDSAGFMKGMEVVAYIIIGGAGTLAGPLVGPLVMIAIPEMLQIVPEIRGLLFGIILVLFIIFLPRGVAGEVSLLISRIKSQSKHT
jgi:branched-chain amino acid transport system permease protein